MATLPWPGEIRLITDRLEVRGLSWRDRRAVLTFLQKNAAFHNPWEPARPAEFFTSAFQKKIIRDQLRDPAVVQLYLYRRESGRGGGVIGSITFSNIILGAFQSCFLGYKLDQDCMGRGLMTEGLSVALRYVFVHEHLHRVEANIMPENERSRRLVERLGFREEGMARRYLQIQGRWADHVHYALLSDEFLNRGLDDRKG